MAALFVAITAPVAAQGGPTGRGMTSVRGDNPEFEQFMVYVLLAVGGITLVGAYVYEWFQASRRGIPSQDLHAQVRTPRPRDIHQAPKAVSEARGRHKPVASRCSCCGRFLRKGTATVCPTCAAVDTGRSEEDPKRRGAEGRQRRWEEASQGDKDRPGLDASGTQRDAERLGR